MALKDNFSLQSKEYAKFRPRYPKEVFDFLVSLTIQQKLAWDCGTGNGQVASVLAESFDKVYATDISENQISHAVQKPNISYHVEEAGAHSVSRPFRGFGYDSASNTLVSFR
jgi:2-polyprenyl-3-methyl-5-hydroxy-6-metoxy-1,4-benzoquinol methylase